MSVATPAPPTVRRDPGERAEDLDGWPPRGWGGNGDGEGGGGGGGGGGDGWGHDPWDDLSRPGTAELALMLSLICIGVLFFVFCGVALLFAVGIQVSHTVVSQLISSADVARNELGAVVAPL